MNLYVLVHSSVQLELAGMNMLKYMNPPNNGFFVIYETIVRPLDEVTSNPTKLTTGRLM